MATKKSASKKTAGSEAGIEKTAAKKTPAKKAAAAKTVDVQASAPEQRANAPANGTTTHQPSHHDVSVRAYLLWEKDGKKHGHHDHYWKQAEQELKG